MVQRFAVFLFQMTSYLSLEALDGVAAGTIAQLSLDRTLTHF